MPALRGITAYLSVASKGEVSELGRSGPWPRSARSLDCDSPHHHDGYDQVGGDADDSPDPQCQTTGILLHQNRPGTVTASYSSVTPHVTQPRLWPGGENGLQGSACAQNPLHLIVDVTRDVPIQSAAAMLGLHPDHSADTMHGSSPGGVTRDDGEMRDRRAGRLGHAVDHALRA